jgi:hypothetical protein
MYSQEKMGAVHHQKHVTGEHHSYTPHHSNKKHRKTSSDDEEVNIKKSSKNKPSMRDGATYNLRRREQG